MDDVTRLLMSMSMGIIKGCLKSNPSSRNRFEITQAITKYLRKESLR